jgi:uncharacterized protein
MHRLALLAAIALGVAAPSAAQAILQTDSPLIQAQGEASVKHAPDIAWVQIAVESRGNRPEEARDLDAKAMTVVIDALKKMLPAEAVKTSIVSVQPEMEYQNNVPKVKDYVARNQVDVRVDDLQKLAGVIDVSVGSGATSVSSLRYDVKGRAQLEREALRLAVEDGMERARAMATGAGRALGSLVRLTEQRQSSQGIVFRAGVAGGGGRGGAAFPTETPITPGEIEIRAVVTLTVALK